MPRSSRIESAVGVVGSFAPSTTTLQSIDRAFLSRVITPPRAHGTSQSHGISHSSSLVIARPSFHSETGRFCAACASRPGMSRPLSLTMPPFTSLTAITLAPASVSSSRARWPPTLPKPWITKRPPLRGMTKSRAHAALGPAEGNVHERGLPRHDGGQSQHLVVVGLRVVADAALARPPCAVVLDAVAGEHLDVAVVHPHRHLHLHFAERGEQDAPQVALEVDEVGGAVELAMGNGLARHRGTGGDRKSVV